MRIQLSPVLATLCVAGFVAAPVFAASNQAAPDRAEMQKLEVQVQSLQQQIRSLNTRVYYQAAKMNTRSAGAPPVRPGTTGPSPTNQQTQEIHQFATEETEYLPFDMDVPGQAFVSTGPYVGVPFQYAGSNLIINSPSINLDVQMLNIRKKISEQLHAMGGELVKEPYHSHLLFSGVLEAQAGYFKPEGGSSTSDIDVTNVSLDAFFLGPSNWTLGFVEFSYDPSAPVNSVWESNNHYRASNSRVLINKAFITIGDFSQSPLYGTVGQYYVPFGLYASSMVSEPLTKLLARTKARAILFGLQGQGKTAFYGSIYGFRGDSHVGSVSSVNNGGINLGLKFDNGYFSGNVGGGILANLADSGGMQLGANFSNNERIVHRVPAYDLRAILSIGTHVDIIGEFITASTNFSQQDMTYNGHGAKPWASDLEADYSFYILDNKPSSVGIDFSKSYQALALGIPLNRYGVVFNTSLFRNTLQSLEFRRDQEYPGSYTAYSPAGATVATTESGRWDNAVTAQFDYYF